MATPKWVLKFICNLRHNFLWGGEDNHQKWELVKLKNVTLPKQEGGLGIHDPEVNNEILSAKIWWNWIVKNTTPWALSSNKNYAHGWIMSTLIFYDPDPPRSLIWIESNFQ